MAADADLVIVAGTVFSSGTRRGATAVAVRGRHIVAVAPEATLGDLVGAATRVVRAPEAMLVPGFQDAHVHAPPAGRNRRTVLLDDLPGKDAYLAAVAAYASAHPDVEWIVGGGWAMEHFPGGLPDRIDLDAVVPDRPVFLFNRDVHGAWVNTRALELAGIDERTPDPADGRIERDGAGRPTGMLHEGAAYSVNDTVVPPPTHEEWLAAVLEAQSHLHSLGITGWQDAWVTPATLAAYLDLADSGRLTARVVGALWWDRHRGLDQVADLCAQRDEAGGRDRFRATTVKIMVDGVLENYTAALLDPYGDGRGNATDNRGISFVERDLLVEAVTELDRLGFQVHLHTIGDRAVRDALDAIEAARSSNGVSDHRHHLAHIQVVQPDDVPRFRELDVVANCQAYWAVNDAQMTELTVPFLGEERVAMMYPFRDLQEAGARLAMGSDWPVSTADPLAQLEVAATRVPPTDRSTRPFRPDQRLTAADAMSAFTAGSAFVNHDDEGGALEPGMRADLVLIDRDVLGDGAGPLGDARVELTVAAGQVVFER